MEQSLADDRFMRRAVSIQRGFNRWRDSSERLVAPVNQRRLRAIREIAALQIDHVIRDGIVPMAHEESCEAGSGNPAARSDPGFV